MGRTGERSQLSACWATGHRPGAGLCALERAASSRWGRGGCWRWAEHGRELGQPKGKGGEGDAAGPLGWRRGKGRWTMGRLGSHLGLGFPFLFQTTLKLFEFKSTLNSNSYALNPINLMHQHEYTNMLNLRKNLIPCERKLNQMQG